MAAPALDYVITYQWCHVMPKTSKKRPPPTAPPPLAAKGKGAKNNLYYCIASSFSLVSVCV